MKKNLVLLLIMGAALHVSAQLTDEDITALEPSHYQTKVIVYTVPAYLDMGGLNFGYGYGLAADGFVMKRFSYGAGFTASYSDNKYKNGNDQLHADSRQAINKSGAAYVNFGFHIVDRIGIGRIRVEKYKGMVVTGDKMAHVYDIYKKRGPVRKILAVRGGLYTWKSGVSPESGDEWLLLNQGGTVPVAATDRYFTNCTTSNFSVGLASGKVVAGSNMGAAGVVSYFRHFYVDALINTSAKLDKVRDSFGLTSTFQMDKGTLTKVPIGWRVGWKTIGLARKYWVGGFYMEAGVRPGIVDRGPFMQMGLILGTKYPFVPIK